MSRIFPANTESFLRVNDSGRYLNEESNTLFRGQSAARTSLNVNAVMKRVGSGFILLSNVFPNRASRLYRPDTGDAVFFCPLQ